MGQPTSRSHFRVISTNGSTAISAIAFLGSVGLHCNVSFMEAAVTVNGRHPKASTKLRKGDVVDVVLPPPPSSDLPAEEIPINIIHEDPALLIIDKHDDIIVHPARGNQSGTIINGLAWHFQQSGSGSLSEVGAEQARPGVVHRLDRHTTGVMVVAKTETAHWRIGKQFEERLHKKTVRRTRPRQRRACC